MRLPCANAPWQCQPALTARSGVGEVPGGPEFPAPGLNIARFNVRTMPHRFSHRPSALTSAAAALLLTLGACNRHERHRHEGDGPPNLGGQVVDAQGVAHTLVDVRAVVAVGDSKTDTLPQDGQLFGYEFEAFRGAAVTGVVEVDTDAGDVEVGLYGPRSTQGLWDAALAATHGRTPGSVTVTSEALPTGGMYLVLVQSQARQADVSFDLHLTCAGNCGEPACPDLKPCDLVCPDGFVPDADGCRTCACQTAPQCGDGIGACPTGQTCGTDARCHDDPLPAECMVERPVCDQDDHTWPNRCLLDRAGATFAHNGACQDAPPPACDAAHPCTAPATCEQGVCTVPACSCMGPAAPVCSTAGHTYRNRCELDCREGAAGFDHTGECSEVRPCRVPADCGANGDCMPVPDPANMQRCHQNPQDAACQRQCVMGQEPVACGAGQPACLAGQTCVSGGAGGRSACLMTCTLADAQSCDAGLACTTTDGATMADGQGVCLPTCRADQPAACPPGLECRANDAGIHVCESCGCPEPQRGDEVCTDQQIQYASACLAQCAQAANWRDGRCDRDAPCQCPSGWAPGCAPDGSLYNHCEASCEMPGAVLSRPVDCLPAGTDLVLACNTDADCAATACDGRLCAAAPLPDTVCPTLSDELTCYASAGRCGCLNHRCGFAPTQPLWCTVECNGCAASPM